MSELDARVVSEVATLVGMRIEPDETIATPGTLPPGETGPIDDGAEPEVIRVLGEGAMGVVELVRQPGLDREVALKRLKPGIASAAAAEALVREARLTGSLEHPNIVPIHQLQRDPGGHPRLMMKRLEGVSWRELLRDPHHPLWGEDSTDRLTRHLEILARVTHALHFAHSRGVIHRDVKPANVMVGGYGEVYLVDWGLAARAGDLAGQGWAGICGTPAYIAPEQLRPGSTLDPRTDVYQLGATLHEVLTGRPRHEGASLEAVLRAAVRSQPVTYGPEVPGELAELCNRATASEPADRPASALEFRQALEEYQRHRASTDLSRDALARLARLRGEAGALEETPMRQLVTECRFGFLQALRIWDGNAPAREGLRECLEHAVDFELRHGHVSAAATLLAELPEPPANLTARLEGLRARRREQEKAVEELAAQRWNRGLGARWYLRAYTAATLNGILGAAALTLVASGQTARPIHGAFATGVMTAAFTLMNTVFRRRMIQTETNRKHLGSLWLTMSLVFLQQTYGWRTGIEFESSLRVTLLVMLAMSGVLAVTLVTKMVAITASASAALAFSLLSPGRPLLAVAVFCLTNSVTFLTWLSRDPEETRAGPPPPPAG